MQPQQVLSQRVDKLESAQEQMRQNFWTIIDKI